MYWYQGFDGAPPVIKPCIERWKSLHPDWEIYLLDQHSIYEYAAPLPIKKKTLDQMILPHQSDLLRTQLLINHGGVWADPTTFPLIALDEWLLDKMDAGYFFFYKPGRDRIIANWFIAAEKNNHMLKTLYDALIDYWNRYELRNVSDPKSKKIKIINKYINRNLDWPRLWFTPIFTRVFRLCTYMVYHHKFYDLLKKDKSLYTQFKKMPKLSARKPLVLKKELLYAPLSEKIKMLIDEKQTPIIKLNWRMVDKTIQDNTNLAYLLQQH